MTALCGGGCSINHIGIRIRWRPCHVHHQRQVHDLRVARRHLQLPTSHSTLVARCISLHDDARGPMWLVGARNVPARPATGSGSLRLSVVDRVEGVPGCNHFLHEPRCTTCPIREQFGTSALINIASISEFRFRYAELALYRRSRVDSRRSTSGMLACVQCPGRPAT